MTIRCLTTLLLLTTLAAAPATAPSSLKVRANAAFTQGQYALALPLLQKLEAQLKDQPDRLGAIQEQIRVCQKEIATAAKANNTTTEQILAAAEPPPTNEDRKPHAAPKPGETRELAIKDLGNFEYDADKGGNIPADVKALSGTTIRLNGFMIPIDQAENITQFALVPSLFACCFGQPPQIQHTIVCKAPAGKAVSYYPDELTVTGKLKVEEKKDDGFIISVFEIDVDSVKPAVK